MLSNGAREITNYLESIRAKIQNIESRLVQESLEINHREENNKDTLSRLDEISLLQKNIVNFNISGKLYPIDKNMLLFSEYENILSNILRDRINKYGEENIDLSDILIDRNRKLFRIIIDILRSKADQIKGRIPEGRIDFLVKCDPETLKDEIAYYFKGESYDKIFVDFKLYYIQNNETRILYSNNTSINQLLLDFKVLAPYPDERLDIFRASSIEDINSLDSFKAVFCDFESSIIFEFGDIVKCSAVDLRPFLGDFELWFSGNGRESKVEYSKDGITWQKIGNLPIDYGLDYDVIYSVEFGKEIEFKFIKFETENEALSIGYINFI